MKKIIVLIFTITFIFPVVGVFAQNQIPQAQLKPTEQFVYTLRDYLNKIDREGNATAQDWEEYVKRIYPDSNLKRISFPLTMSNEQKKKYLMNIALAMLWAKNKKGPDNLAKFPPAITEIKCEVIPTGEFGKTKYFEATKTAEITCPPYTDDSMVLASFTHELAHRILNHPYASDLNKDKYEGEVANFILKNLPSFVEIDPKKFPNPTYRYPAWYYPPKRFNIFPSPSPSQSSFQGAPSTSDNVLEVFLVNFDPKHPSYPLTKDPNTHEAVHGMNAQSRVMFKNRSGTGLVIGFENNKPKAVWMNEPQSTILQVKDVVPDKARKLDVRYTTYFLQPRTLQRDRWTNITYLFDEWAAYNMGGYARLKGEGGGLVMIGGVADYIVFGTAVAKRLVEIEPEYAQSENFRAVLKLMIEQSADVFKKAVVYEKEKGKVILTDSQRKFFEYMRTDSETADLRKLLKDFYGEDWTKQVLGF